MECHSFVRGSAQVRNRSLNLLVALVVGLLPFAGRPATGAAQTVLTVEESLDFDRPEAWAMKLYTSLTFLNGFGPNETTEPGRVVLGLEVGSVPQLSEDEARVGFAGTKVDDLNKTSVFGRVRASLALANGLAVEVGFIPPVELNGAKPLLFSLAVAKGFAERDDYRFGVRVYGQVGKVEGDFTCSADRVALGGDQPADGFFCREVSADETFQRYAGVEIGGALTTSSAIEPFAAVAVNYLDLRFDVHSVYEASGLIIDDDSKMTASGPTVSGTVGVRVPLNDRLTLGAAAFYTPLSIVRTLGGTSANEGLFNVRALVSYAVRR